MKREGFTLIEIIVVLGIIGIVLAASYPSIMNVLEARALESAARDLLTTLEAARYTAVNEKVNCRVRFFQENKIWRYMVEIEETKDNWQPVPKFIKKTLPPKFNPQLKLPPSMEVVFSPLGIIRNFDFTNPQNFTIILQSAKLKNLGQDDRRIISIYAGGSVGYKKTKS